MATKSDVSQAGSTHSSHALIVNPIQVNNPLMRHVRRVPWERGDIVPDFVMGRTTCALFLSIRYHSLHPNYIHDRLKTLGYLYEVRVLLVLVDSQQYHNTLKELSKTSLAANLTLIVCWSSEEAAKYLESYKIFENKPPDILMEQSDNDLSSRIMECLTSVKKINKTDSTSLLNMYKTLDSIITANKEDLTLCPGLGPQKAERLYQVFHEPFIKPH